MLRELVTCGFLTAYTMLPLIKTSRQATNLALTDLGTVGHEMTNDGVAVPKIRSRVTPFQ